jgi:hypothetical protein
MKTELRLILVVLYKQFLNIHSKKGSVLKSLHKNTKQLLACRPHNESMCSLHITISLVHCNSDVSI